MRTLLLFAGASLQVCGLVGCGARTPLFEDAAGGGGAGASASSASSSSHAASSTSSSSSSSTGTGNELEGPTISLSSFSFFEAETSITVDPAAKRLASAWIAVTGDATESVMGYAFSTDGGATWTDPSFVSSPDGRAASDPVLARHPDGRFFLTWVGFFRDPQGNPLDMHVYVSESPAGSATFGAPVEVSNPTPDVFLLDKPWIAISSSGAIAVSFADIQQNGGFDEDVATSLDGTAWSHSKIAKSPSFQTFYNLAFLCSDATTQRLTATLLGQDQNSGDLDLYLVHSDDQGTSWSQPKKIAGPSVSGELVSFDDPTCYAADGTVSVLYGVSDMPLTGESQSSVALRLATFDAAENETQVRDVQDASAGVVFQHPTIAGDGSGAMSIAFYAGQFEGDPDGSYRVGRLTADPTKTSAYQDPIFYTIERDSIQWLGDYTGLVMDGGVAYTSFVTNQPSESHIAFTKLGP